MRTGSKESYEDSLKHFRSLVRRGLRMPLIVTTGGAPGSIRQSRRSAPKAIGSPAGVHKMQNELSKATDDVRADG